MHKLQVEKNLLQRFALLSYLEFLTVHSMVSFIVVPSKLQTFISINHGIFRRIQCLTFLFLSSKLQQSAHEKNFHGLSVLQSKYKTTISFEEMWVQEASCRLSRDYYSWRER
jgi:hypothetical protein